MKSRIKKLRLYLGLTQEQFAEKLNLSGNYVYLIEKGDRTPSDRTVSDICRVFGVNEIWLYTGNGEMFGSVSEAALEELCAQHDCDDLDRSLIDAYLNLSPEQRSGLKQLVIALIQDDTKKEEGKS